MKNFIIRRILLALFAALVAAPVAFGDAPPDWRPLMKENQPALVTFMGKDWMHSEMLQSPDYFKAVNALRARDTVSALKHVDALVKAYPGDPVVRLLQIDILYDGGRDGELDELLASLSRPDSMVKFDRFSLLDQRLRSFRNKRQWDQAIATAHEAVDCSPPDFPATAFNLAECYASRGKETGNRDDYLAAEKWYKVAMKSGSDHIAILTSYESILAQLQRWEESDAVTERIHELERIYQ